MIHEIQVVLVVLMLSACQSTQPVISDEKSAFGTDYTLVNMPGNSRVSIQIAWPSQWASDASNNQAVPYIGTRLLLAGGAKGYAAGEVVERFADMNSEGQLAPSVDYVFGTLHYSPEHQDETLRMANAHLRSPALDEAWFARIRDEFSAQMQQMQANAASTGFEAMRWAVFGKQPVRAALSLDEPDMINEVTQAEVANWVKTVLKRGVASIVVAGDLDVDEAGAVVDTLFDGMPDGDTIGGKSIDTNFSSKRILMHVPEATTSTLSFIGKLPSSRDGSEFEDIMLAQALGGGSQSVLFEAVRTELRASYGYTAGIDAFSREHRILVLSGEVETSKIAEAEKTIRQAYKNFRTNGPSGDLQQRKEPIKAHLKESFKDTGTMASSALLAKLDGQASTRTLALQEELDAVTGLSLQQRLNTSFPAVDEFIVVVSSPDANALANACVITSPAQAADC